MDKEQLATTKRRKERLRNSSRTFLAIPANRSRNTEIIKFSTTKERINSITKSTESWQPDQPFPRTGVAALRLGENPVSVRRKRSVSNSQGLRSQMPCPRARTAILPRRAARCHGEMTTVYL